MTRLARHLLLLCLTTASPCVAADAGATARDAWVTQASPHASPLSTSAPVRTRLAAGTSSPAELLPPPTPPEQALAPSLHEPGCVGCDSTVGHSYNGGDGHRYWLLDQLALRHSSTHGRAMGNGGPLRGTSWLNRPYYWSFDFGALLMTDRPATNVRANNDLLGAIGLGWDWDHYWGNQFRVAWSTPELLNTTQPSPQQGDNLLIGDFTFLYYPWGDSRLRPYYRFGFGLTDLEYVNDFGVRIHETLYTIPLGVGLKYQHSRFISWRLELMDNIAVGQNETDTMGNLTLTTGLEWRFGGRPSGYWAWAGEGVGW